MRVRATLILSITLALILTLWWAVASRGSAPSAHAIRVDERGAGARQAMASRSPEHSVRQEVAKAGIRRIAVKDATGKPVEHATVYGVKEPARTYARVDLQQLGVTAASGVIELPSSSLRDARVVLVRHQDFEASETPVTPHLDPIEVVLRRAATLELVCSTRDEQPIPGVVFEGSTGQLPPNSRSRRLAGTRVPGGDRRTAIFRGVSDVSGRVKVGALPTDSIVSVRVFHRNYVLAKGLPGAIKLKPGRTELHLTLDPLYGVYAQIKGDRVLTWSIRHGKWLRIPQLSVMSLSERRKRGPGTIHVLGCPKFKWVF